VDRIHFYRLLWKAGIQTRETPPPDAGQSTSELPAYPSGSDDKD
jgi:hypothetical protein